MRKLSRRALSGIVFVSVIIFSILYSKITFMFLFYVVMMICLYEFSKMIKLKSIFPYIIGSLFFIFGNVINIEDDSSYLPFINCLYSDCKFFTDMPIFWAIVFLEVISFPLPKIITLAHLLTICGHS